MLLAAFIMAALHAGVPRGDVHSPPATPTPHHHHLRPRRQNFDRQPAYVVVAFVASG